MSISEAAPEQVAVAAPKRRRRRWRVWLGLLAAILVVLVGDVVLAGTLIVQGATPQVNGTIQLAGPDGPITVIRDRYGVPHVQAGDIHDALFAQGYVTAQDRLWQMDFNRRIAAGRLAEIFGSQEVDADKFLRTLGLAQSAQSDVARLSPDLHAELDAYTQGVNAFIDGHRDALPLEFRILGYTPEPWQDTDSIAYGKVIALDLDNAWSAKLARMDVLNRTGSVAATAALFPAYPDDNPTLIDKSGVTEIAPNSEQTTPSGQPIAGGLAFSLTQAQQAVARQITDTPSPALDWLRNDVLGSITGALGSNDWVVAGSHSTTGMPLLANDPHLGIQYPSIWYEVALQGGPLDEIGYSFPGVPSVIIGHNEHISWGVTNGMVDDTDLYIERLSADGSTYLSDGQMLPLQTRQETIKVAGGKSVTFTVRSTRHGPILNDVVSQLKMVQQPIALQWTALQPDYTFAGFFELGLAQDWTQFQAAVQDISISQNFVYADTTGNIGYRLSGWVPIRPAANGWLPVDGSTSTNDWTGRVSFDQMPHLFNPPSGIIWTANNRIVPTDYPYFVTNDWDSGFRARRIEQLLTAKPRLSADDIAAIQNDVVSLPAQQIAPIYLAVAQKAGGSGPAKARALLQGWNGTMARDSAAASFFEVTSTMLIQDLVKSQLGDKTFQDWNNNEQSVNKLLFLRDELVTPQSPFLAGTSARDTAIMKAENEAAAYLKQHFNTDDATKWQWGQLHQAHFDHP
ncbi:MAG TPA: penicillin acylase family protein, partial [Ktedonobacterales bacterium]|nr:penicillin acylase family protein [Ktedonobacterales bacterium]